MKINIISKLKVRKADEKIDWQKLFEINQCVKFKLFHETFDSNSYTDSYFQFFSKNMNITYGFGATLNSFDFILEEFIEPSKIIEVKNRVYFEEEEDLDLIDENYLPIGICSMNQILLLGINELNADEIFLDSFFKEPRIKFIANDIFELLRGIEIESKNYGDFNDFSDLYKNWGEDFWRIRED